LKYFYKNEELFKKFPVCHPILRRYTVVDGEPVTAHMINAQECKPWGPTDKHSRRLDDGRGNRL